jgi:hypothetical protein
MTLSVRIPPRIEQELAAYCVSHDTSRSEVVQRLLENFLVEQARAADAPLPAFVGCDEGSGDDVSGNIKQTLRARFRPA